MGFTAIVAQIVLVRELLTSFSGNELAIGIFFANWLLLEALGSYGTGRWADRVKSGIPYYVSLQLFLALAFPAVIFLTRIIKPLLGIVPGQGVNILTVFYAALLLLIPLALPDGAQFSFGCRLFADEKKKEKAGGAGLIGKVYIFEAIGSLLGGIAGTYVCLQHLNAFQTACTLALLNLSSGLLLLLFAAPTVKKTSRSSLSTLKIITGLLLLAGVLLLPLGGVDYLQTRSVSAQWRDYEVRDHRNSIYGNVTVLERFNQLNIMSNGMPFSTIPTPDIAFIEEFAHLPLLAHPDPRSVLLIGGGVGGTLREMLKHPLQRVDYTELDPLIIETARRHAPVFAAEDIDDSRVLVHPVDGRYFLRATDKTFDLIMINLPDPATLEINRFYTQEFFRLCSTRLQKEGIVCFLLPGSTSYLSRELVDLNGNVIRTLERVFPHRSVIPGERNIVLASSNTSISTLQPEVLIQRMADRNLTLQLLSEFHLRYKFNETRRQWYDREISRAADMPANRDFHPSALFYDLMFWNSIHSPGFAKFFIQLKHLRLHHILLALTVILLLLWSLQRMNVGRKRMAILVPIIATGFSGMGVDIVLVLAFQSFYGYVYHWIGLLIAAFMVGLALGGMWMTRQLQDNRQPRFGESRAAFLKLEFAMVLYTLLLFGVLVFLNRMQDITFIWHSIQYILLLLNALCGFLVGAEFPLANDMVLHHADGHSQTAGSLYGADLVGSWLGGLFVTIALIPVLGILSTCLLILCLNIGSFLFFYSSTR